jgi:hypothetical protein
MSNDNLTPASLRKRKEALRFAKRSLKGQVTKRDAVLKRMKLRAKFQDLPTEAEVDGIIEQLRALREMIKSAESRMTRQNS